MSLMASAQRMRMKKKREKVTSPTNGGKTTTTTTTATTSSIVSPRNNNNDGKEDVPSGTGNNGRGGGGGSGSVTVSPTNNNALSPTSSSSSSPIIATLNGVTKSHYHHHAPSGNLSPTRQHQPQHALPQQQQQQLQLQPSHPPRPPIHGSRRPPYGVGGINSLESSGDYMVDNNNNTQPQWQQQQHPQQQQQQQQHRGISPSPSPQQGLSPSPSPDYQILQLHHNPSPTAHHNHHHHHHHPLQQPPLINNNAAQQQQQQPQSPGTFDAATRYQGNYTNYLSPRMPHRVPSRPRRRYDSFEKAPEDAAEEELLQHQRQQHQRHQQQQQQQQAFDPFAPSPLTIDPFASSNRSNNGRMGSNNNGGVGMNNGMNGGMNNNNNGVGMNNNGMYALDYNNNNGVQHQVVMTPQNLKGSNQQHHQQQQQPTLTTIEGKKLGIFVYDPETDHDPRTSASPPEQGYLHRRQESEDYHEDDGEIVSANEGSRFFGDHDDIAVAADDGVAGSDAATTTAGTANVAEGSYGSEPPPLIRSYDFEYHTEKDEASTFDQNDGGGGGEGEMRLPETMTSPRDPYAEEEGGDETAPLPPGMDAEGVYGNGVASGDVVDDPRYRSSTNAAHRRRGDPPPDFPVGENPPSSLFDNQTVAEQTIDSERALYGTPSNKKKKKKETPSKKKRRGDRHRSKIIFDNVNKAEEESADLADDHLTRSNSESAVGGGGGIVSGRDPRYGIHYPEDGDDDDDNSLLEPNSNEGIHDDSHNHHHDSDRRHHEGNVSHPGIAIRARGEMAASARRIASNSDSNSQFSDGMERHGSDGEPGRIPSRMSISSDDHGGDPFFPVTSNENNDGLVHNSDTQFFSPPRIGVSKSWDSHVEDTGNKQQVGDTPSTSFGSFSRNLMWDDDNDGNDNLNGSERSIGAQQEQQQGRATRASKSWDEEGNSELLYPAVDESIGTWGTWGDNTASFGGATGAAGGATVGNSFGADLTADGFGGVGDNQDPFGSDKENLFQQQKQQQQQQQQQQQNNTLFQQEDDEINAKALAEWDKAEAEWREKSMVEDVSIDTKEDQTLPSSFLNTSIQTEEQPPSSQPKLASIKSPPLLSPPKQKKSIHHPWKSSTSTRSRVFGKSEKPSEEVLPNESSSELTEFGENEPARFSAQVKLPPEEDDDSIFEFDKRGGSMLSGLSGFTGLSGLKKQPESAESSQQSLPQIQPSSSPTDIFSKINSSLEMASQTKNHALGIETDLTNEHTEVADEEQRAHDEAVIARVRESPSSQTSQGSILSAGSVKDKSKGAGKRIAFAVGAPQVHTYLAPEESSDSEKEYEYDDTEEYDDSRNDMADEEGERAVAAAEMTQEQQQSQKGIQIMSESLSSTIEDTREQEASDNDTCGESTLGESTYNEPTNEGGHDQGGGDWALMDHVDNAVTLVAASLGGLFGVASPTSASTPSQSVNEKSDSSRVTADRSSVGAGSDRGESTRSLVTEDEERSVATDIDNDTYGGDTYGESTVQSTQYTGRSEYTGKTSENSEDDWLGYMRNIIFPKDIDGASIISGRSDALGSAKYSGTYDGDESTYGAEDEDSYLLQQALAAARAIHHVQGVEYDETQEINVLTDIKFVVATVSLPLGLLFQEHEIGVWVSRVVPGGNGAQKGVQHGDQLAAINGNSSVHTTIDEVASTISGTPSDIGVELTFLRYVGPLRPVPGSIIQEGFEVTDTSVSSKKMKEEKAARSKRSLFSKKKSSNKVTSGGGGGGAALDISPKNPNRISRSSPPKQTNAATHPPPKSSSASMASSSKASSKQSSQGSAPSMPTLPEVSAPPPKQSTKKKKGLGKKLMSFKKK